MPHVSVVVPCYNYGHFLGECVDSLLSQTGVEVDVLIIDDDSPDGSGDIADELANGDRVRSLRHARNRGHIATYNEGLDLVEGEYVVLLDADDVIAPGAFARATQLMEANPSVGLVYGNPQKFSLTVPTVPATKVRSWSVWSGPAWIRAQCRRGLSIIYSPEVVMRNSVRRAVGGFRTELPHAGDLEMWLRIAAVADIGRVNGPDQAFRRVHSQSMMQTGYGTVLADLRGRLDAYETFFQHHASGLPDFAELRDLSRRTTAIEALNWVCTTLHAGGPVDETVIQEYVAFAREICPYAEKLREWHEYTWFRHEAGGTRAVQSIRRHGFALRRNIRGRYTWQRWYWRGV
ncbi:MAG TPA: glycosyltransferase family 2 protein [Jatrophihabitantaceae bacterium]